MENIQINNRPFVKAKATFLLLVCALALTTSVLSACNNQSKTESNTNNADPAVHNDTSSAVTPKVDTTPAVHDHVAKKP